MAGEAVSNKAASALTSQTKSVASRKPATKLLLFYTIFQL